MQLSFDRIAADTNALIRYFGIEMKSEQSVLSKSAINLFQQVEDGEIKLVISTFSLIEIWANLKLTEDNIAIFKSAFNLLIKSENVIIVELNKEVLEGYIRLNKYDDFKEHDRIIYSTAMVYQCSHFISTDTKIKEYIEYFKDPIKIVS